jgi:hypothetical protein
MPNLTHPNSLVTRGFWLAAAYNVVGMLVFSKLFTNSSLALPDPVVFSWFGQVAIVLWGLAYWSVAKSYQHVPLLLFVFAVEKLAYALNWLSWLAEKGATISAIAAESLLTAMFYTIYGAGDIAFCIFFSWVAVRVMRERASGLA